MKDYLTQKQEEVFSMLDLQWNLDDAKQAWFHEGETNKAEKIASNLLRMGMDFDYIHQATELSIEKIIQLSQLYSHK